MGVAVGILSLGALEVEIALGGIFTPPLDHIKVAKHLGTARVNVHSRKSRYRRYKFCR